MLLVLWGLSLMLGATATSPVQPPLTVASRVDPGGEGEAVITNLSTVPLTAYVLQLFLEPCNPSPRPDVFRVFDTVQTPDQGPVLTSQVRIEALGVAHCNKIGTSIPGRGELRAAIYQDGSTFGQQRWIDALLERRRRQIAEIDTAIRFLQAGADGAPSAESLAARFEATSTASQAKDAVSVPRVFDIREFVLKSLRGPGSSQVAQTIRGLERLQKQLLDAKPARR